MRIVMYFNLLTMLVFVVVWTGVVLFLRLRKKKDIIHLIFLTVFYVYIVKVLDYTLFQFQSLVIVKHFMPNLILRGQTYGESINLIPLISLTPEDLATSFLNILLLIPFGFGLPFITSFRMKKTVIMGALFSIFIELMQLLTGGLAGISFRIADINDVIFNTMGVVIGYILFIVFLHFFYHAFYKRSLSTNPFLRSIAERPQINKS